MELRDAITAVVSDAMTTAGRDWAAQRLPTGLPTEFADRILAEFQSILDEIVDAEDISDLQRKIAAKLGAVSG